MLDNATLYTVISLSSSIRASGSKIPNKLTEKDGSVLGSALEPLELTTKRRLLCKLQIH